MWSLALCWGETPPGDQGRTWVHLTVAGNSVRVDNVLESGCEGVEGEQGGWRRGGGQAVVERVDTAATFPLMMQRQGKKGNCETFIIISKTYRVHVVNRVVLNYHNNAKWQSVPFNQLSKTAAVQQHDGAVEGPMSKCNNMKITPSKKRKYQKQKNENEKIHFCCHSVPCCKHKAKILFCTFRDAETLYWSQGCNIKKTLNTALLEHLGINWVWLRPLTPPSLRALCSSGSLAVGHQASAIRHLSVTDGLQRLSTICTALHFCTRTFHWGSTATACISTCCRKVSVCSITYRPEGSASGWRCNVSQRGCASGGGCANVQCVRRHSRIACLRFWPPVPAGSPPAQWGCQGRQMSAYGSCEKNRFDGENVKAWF